MFRITLLILFFYLIVIPESIAFNEITISLTVSIIEEDSDKNWIGNVIYESKSEINKKKIPFFIAGVFFVFLVILIWKKL